MKIFRWLGCGCLLAIIACLHAGVSDARILLGLLAPGVVCLFILRRR